MLYHTNYFVLVATYLCPVFVLYSGQLVILTFLVNKRMKRKKMMALMIVRVLQVMQLLLSHL